MTFRVRKDRFFCNGGEVYTATVVARKLNGYKVLNPDGEPTFVCFDDIEILDVSDEEKNMPIEW